MKRQIEIDIGKLTKASSKNVLDVILPAGFDPFGGTPVAMACLSEAGGALGCMRGGGVPLSVVTACRVSGGSSLIVDPGWSPNNSPEHSSSVEGEGSSRPSSLAASTTPWPSITSTTPESSPGDAGINKAEMHTNEITNNVTLFAKIQSQIKTSTM